MTKDWEGFRKANGLHDFTSPDAYATAVLQSLISNLREAKFERVKEVITHLEEISRIMSCHRFRDGRFVKWD